MARRARIRLAVAALCLVPSAAQAFIYPEHRDITATALRALDPARRTTLEALWSTARPTFVGPVCAANLREPSAALGCLDLADLPALAGDHSCSPHDLVLNTVPSRWVLRVTDVAQRTKESLAQSRSPDAIYNRLASMHLSLQNVDPQYLSRAGGNSAHFLLARQGDTLEGYVEQSVHTAAPVNALGLYVQYHVAALRLAHALGRNTAGPRSAAARDVLVLEAFAAHWLEDMFAAGHAAGTWGDASWRKGTHDYYNEHGLDTTTWGGKRMIAFGDANMKTADREARGECARSESRAGGRRAAARGRAGGPGERLWTRPGGDDSVRLVSRRAAATRPKHANLQHPEGAARPAARATHTRQG